MTADSTTAEHFTLPTQTAELVQPNAKRQPPHNGADPLDRLSRLKATLRRVALRPVLDPSWDSMMYTCVGAAVLTTILCAVLPSWTGLAVFTWLMFFTSGPTSTFLPSASEPLLMAFGKIYPPIVLASLGVIGIALVEWVNYRVFSSVVHDKRMTKVRSARLTQQITSRFAAQPFLTTVVAAFTPVPFWVVRVCGVITKYPIVRFVCATAVGRFPRIWLFALLGTALPVSSSVILAGGGIIIVVGAVTAASKRHRLMYADNDAGDST